MGSPLPLWDADWSEENSLPYIPVRDRAGSCWEKGQQGWHHGVAGGRDTAVPRGYCEMLRKGWMAGFPGGVICRAGHQGSRPCTVLSFLQVLFNSRKEASIFWRTGCSCVLCRQIADYEPQYTYSLVCTSSAAALLLQVLLMEITDWWFNFCGFLVEIFCCFINHKHTQRWWGMSLSWLKREHLTSLNFLVLGGRG